MVRKGASFRAKGSGKELAALDAYMKLVRAADSVTPRIHRHLDQAGLTISQFGVLEALYHLGPLCQKDLAEKILKTSGNLTMVIDNLERQALVKRERGETDRRIWNVHLTEKGRRLISQLFPRHATLVAQEMEPLKPAEQATLAKLCQRLGLQSVSSNS